MDYKVRIVDEHLGTGARPRVIIESARGAERWSTVGCSENIIEASWLALCDGLELPLLREWRARAVIAVPGRASVPTTSARRSKRRHPERRAPRVSSLRP